jgi:hypothetical protein
MQVSHGEGVATHIGPELCVASCEAGDEALAGVRAGQVLSPEITTIGVPTSSWKTEGHIQPIASARWAGTPRGPRPWACTQALRRESNSPENRRGA